MGLGEGTGAVDTKALRAFPDREGLLRAARARTPLQGRLATPEDVARAVAFLAGPAAAITGQVLSVDGGASIIA